MKINRLPENYTIFLKDYRELCKKHGLMILSDGEEVEVGEYEKDLWGVRRTTIAKFLKDKEAGK